MKTLIKILFIGFFIKGNLYAQIPTTDVTVVQELERVNATLIAISKTSVSNKIENHASKILSEKNLELAKKGAELFSKVSNTVRQSAEVREIYNTEQRILKKVQLLGKNFRGEGSREFINETKIKVLDKTGILVDNMVQLISDNIFSMQDKERMDYIKEIHRELLAIESIVDGKYHEREKLLLFDQQMENKNETIKTYEEGLKAQRQKLNQM